MSRGGWIVAIIAVVIIWKAPTSAGHFITETWDKATVFIGSIFH